jgi:valyl-tRNA synthetase
VWNELADWYVEASKTRLLTPGDDQQVARAVLVHVFDQALRLLHPIVPFVSEALWQRLPGHVDGTFIATSSWPVARDVSAADARAGQFDVIKQIVEAMRRIRAEYAIAPGKNIDASVFTSPDLRAMLDEEAALLTRMARTSLTLSDAAQQGGGANVVEFLGGIELTVPLAGLIDVAKECEKLKTELANLEKQLASLEARLENQGFIARAPAAVIEGERAKRDEWKTRRELLRTRFEGLCGKA